MIRYPKANKTTLVIGFLIILVISSIITYNLYKPKNTEKLDIFISSITINDDYFINEDKDLDIKKINIISRSVTANYYDEALQTVGLSSDILIIPTSYLDSDTKVQAFVPLDTNFFEKYGINKNQYDLITDSSNNVYGITVYDKDKNIDIFKDIIQFEDDQSYCICINMQSYNCGNYSPYKTYTDNSFIYLYNILKDR